VSTKSTLFTKIEKNMFFYLKFELNLKIISGQNLIPIYSKSLLINNNNNNNNNNITINNNYNIIIYFILI